jgi:hypothetical protein
MVKTLHVDKLLTDDQTKGLIGKFIDETYIKYMIDEDADVYYQGEILMKFRKNVVSDELCMVGWNNFHKLAKHSRGRGPSAGPIDPNSTYWSKRSVSMTAGFRTKYLKPDGSLSKMQVNNLVASNPIGFYESTKSLGVDLPCRLSYYTEHNFKQFQDGIPFFETISDSYEQLHPIKFKDQMGRANQRANLKIGTSPFSTVTINRNFRTACHKDKGDYGFGNLTVLERGSYQGGFFVLPQFGVGVDMRHGDHLCCDVHQVHGNTPIFETPEDKIYNSLLPDIFNDNPAVGCAGLQGEKYSRLTFVCYLRTNILIKCPKESHKFFINLESSTDRKEHWSNTSFIRFPATHWKDLDDHDPLFNKMISYWNVPENQHKAKCGAFMSHVNILQHIIDNHLNNVIICEDDAQLMNPIPDLPDDRVTYLGGFITNRKITKPTPPLNHVQGINDLDPDLRIVMLLSYHIPKWEMARDILNYVTERFINGRVRAIDVEIFNSLDKCSYIYPAPYIERNIDSTIRGKVFKHANQEYVWK